MKFAIAFVFVVAVVVDVAVVTATFLLLHIISLDAFVQFSELLQFCDISSMSQRLKLV